MVINDVVFVTKEVVGIYINQNISKAENEEKFYLLICPQLIETCLKSTIPNLYQFSTSSHIYFTCGRNL